MLFTITDRTYGWREAIPLESTSAKHCTELVMQTWISRFEVPHTITSDIRRKFLSKIRDDMCKMRVIKNYRTASYHPQHNGKVESMHRTIKICYNKVM